GTLFVLDAAGPRVVRFHPSAGGAFTGATGSIALPLSPGAVRGLAFDPGLGHFFTVGVSDRQLYELGGGGAVVAVRDLAPFARPVPQGLLVAPTRDQTDDPGRQSVYLANSGVPVDSSGPSRNFAAGGARGG